MGNQCSSVTLDTKQEFEATISEEKKKDNLIGYRSISSTRVVVSGSKAHRDLSYELAPISEEYSIA